MKKRQKITPKKKKSTAPEEKSSVVVEGIVEMDPEVRKQVQVKLKRPELGPIDPKNDAIIFQQLEIDSFLDTARTDLPFSDQNAPIQTENVLRMYGVNEQGNSILAYIHGFRPYFYVPAWEGFAAQDLNVFGDALNKSLREHSKNNTEKGLRDHVLSINVVKKQSMWGYHFGEQKYFLQIFVALQSLLTSCRRICANGLMINGVRRQFATFESSSSHTNFELRFMIDNKIQGASWIEIPPGSYVVRNESKKQSRCQLEIDLTPEKLIAHQPEGEWQKIAPIRVLSFDIECAGRRGVFPTPDIDPVIQIANVMYIQGAKEEYAFKNIFTLNSCALIPGSDVLAHQTETQLLKAWKEFLLDCDPDILTGYNIINFDLPYLLDRAEALKIMDFPYLGRLLGSRTLIKNSTFQSKAHGSRDNKDMNIEGRIQFDVLAILRKGMKLSSYTLNAVSAKYLNQQKEDVHHSIISDLQNGSAETRRRLAVYCIKDAVLPLRLINKLMLMINHIEMARVTGVTINSILFRGEQIKVLSQLYRKAGQRDLLIPVRDKMEEREFEGATVLEPSRGYYADPITTLDFASLYPSIMMAHNLCYTTMISAQDAKKMSEDDYSKTPAGDYFVKQSVQEGLLPLILRELLDARAHARKLIKEATDPFVKSVLNGRQLALKVSANSVYGFTGATVGQLPCLSISTSVTSYGRDMIKHTMETIESHYTIKNGYQHDAKVIYGDTDSVMIKFGVKTVEESMELGREAAELVTKTFIKPIRLEFEKVYFPYLLIAKKRYAGLYWTKPEKWDKLDAKGLEMVRRDNCPLVRQMVETCLEKMLIDRDVEGAVNYAKEQISKLLQNRLDLSLLVITKALARIESYAGKQAHVELAERMRKRDPSTAPVVGDRVAFVITRAGRNAPTYEKSEDPIYVLEHDIPIDTEYYMSNQLRNPLTRIFEPVLGNVSELFHGDHTRNVKQMVSSKAGGIMQFAVKTRSCLGCKLTLKTQNEVLCEHCKTKESDIYLKQLHKVRENERKFSKLWSECQRCQGSLHEEVLCTSRDCPIFYRRIKVRKELHQTKEKLAQFTF